MKALITGGGGFVGSNLALYLLSKGHSVTVYDNMQRMGSHINVGKIKAAFPQVQIAHKELDDIREFLQKNDFDVIFHFAAQVAVTSSYESPHSDFRINALGTFNVVSATDTPVIYASTNKVYGDNVNFVPIEEHETRYDFSGPLKGSGIPESFSIDSKKHTPYGCSKLVGELYVREFGGVANRFSCMYGPNQFGNTDQGWLSHFVQFALSGKQLTVYGDGKQVRDALFVDDVVRLLELQALNIDKIRGEVFNIGGGYDNVISLLELCSKLGVKPKFEDWRPSDQKVYYSDISKVKRLLGWFPAVSVDDGLKRLIEWHKSSESKLH